MKNTIFTKTIAALLLVVALSFAVMAQTPAKTELDYLRQAFEALKKEDFAAAEKNAREVIRINPKSGDGYAILAYALGLQERMKEAKEAARKAIELSPDDAELRKDMQELIDEGEEESVQNNTANQTSNTGANKTETVNREKSSGNVNTPPLGKYVCNNIRAKMGGGYTFTLMGYLTIEPKSEYLWFDKRGKFSVSVPGKIEWLTGTFAESEAETEFEVKEDNAVIRAKFRTGQETYLRYTCSRSLK